MIPVPDDAFTPNTEAAAHTCAQDVNQDSNKKEGVVLFSAFRELGSHDAGSCTITVHARGARQSRIAMTKAHQNNIYLGGSLLTIFSIVDSYRPLMAVILALRRPPCHIDAILWG